MGVLKRRGCVYDLEVKGGKYIRSAGRVGNAKKIKVGFLVLRF